MVEKEIITAGLLGAGLIGFFYAFIFQMKLRRLRIANEQSGLPTDKVSAEQLRLRRRVFAGYGIFIVSGLILGFV